MVFFAFFALCVFLPFNTMAAVANNAAGAAIEYVVRAIALNKLPPLGLYEPQPQPPPRRFSEFETAGVSISPAILGGSIGEASDVI